MSFDESVDNYTAQEGIKELAADDDLDGILIQMPLPEHLSERMLCNLVPPSKDVDGLSSTSLGNLYSYDFN